MFLKQNKKERKKIDKNQIYIYILTFLIFFWTIASVLGCIGYARTKNSSHNTIKASAETLQEFGLRQYVIEVPAFNGITFISSDTSSNTSHYISVIGNLQIVLGDGEAFMYYGSSIIPLSNPAGSYALDVATDTTSTLKMEAILSSFYGLTNIPNLFLNYSDIQLSTRIVTTLGGTSLRYVIVVSCLREGQTSPTEYNINFNIVPSGDFNTTSFFNSYIGEHPSISSGVVFEGTEDAQGMSLGTFAYYYNLYQQSQSSSNSSYNKGYQNGYASGKSEGVLEGYENGFNEGRDCGYANGKADGYRKGIEDSNQYTFFNLITAVVDAPIQSFTGLFNFDILGVNLASFFLGLLTVGVCLAVLRLIF